MRVLIILILGMLAFFAWHLRDLIRETISDSLLMLALTMAPKKRTILLGTLVKLYLEQTIKNPLI